jgi:hypothetical protein
MRRSALPVILMVSSLVATAPCAGQSLSSRPSIFGDPVLTTDPAYGDLVLGRTTLTAALRMFATELADSVRIPRGHPSNPDTLLAGTRLPGAPNLRPYHRLDLGPLRYTLYFDKHERLVAALTDRSRLPRSLRRDELVARYPTLGLEKVAHTAEGIWVKDDLAAPLGPCVSLVADVWRRDQGLVGELGYVFTCSTRPAPRKAVLDRPR